MPFLKKYRPKKYFKRKRAYRKKRPMFRKKRNNAFSLTIKQPSSTHQPFPNRLKTKLYLEVQGNIPTNTTIPVNRYLVYANDLLAPLNSATKLPNPIQSTGMCPIGFEQLFGSAVVASLSGAMALYDSYTVHASKAIWEFVPTDNTDGIQCVSYPLPTTAGISVSPVDNTQPAEQPYSKSIILNASKKNIMKQYHTTRKLYGLTKQQFAAANSTIGLANTNAGSFSSSRNATTINSPSNAWFHALAIQSSNTNTTLTTKAIAYSCKITYYVEFFSLTQLNIANTRS